MQVRVDNLEVYFDTQGSGKPIVMLHGWGANSNYFAALAQELTKKFQVIRLDFPGFGRSDFPPKAWSLSEYASFMQKFLEQLEIKQPMLVGHSFGGAVVVKLLASHPKLASKLILINSAGVRLPSAKKTLGLVVAKSIKLLFAFTPLRPMYRTARLVLYRLFKVEDFYQADSRLHDTFVKVVSEDLRPILPKVTLPTLILWGNLDQDTPVEQGKIMHQLLPNSKFFVIEGAGHVPFGTHLEECLQRINDFISNA